jgi:hypothetical protein
MEKNKDKTSKKKANMHHEMLPLAYSLPLICYIALKRFEESKLKRNFSNPKVDARLLGKAEGKLKKITED